MFRKRRQGHDVSAELRSHIELEADRLKVEGFSETEANVNARRAFGNVTRTEEQFHESDRLLWLENCNRDVLYALRQALNNKSFTAVVTLTISLGIAATAAIFSLVDATMLRPLPYRDSDRILSIQDQRVKGQSTGSLTGVARFFDLEARSQSLGSAAFYYFENPTMLADDSKPLSVAGAGVSGRFWETVGIVTLHGRAFGPDDDRLHAPSVAVISYQLWQRAFAGKLDIVNRQVKLDGISTTIIGVLPAGAVYPREVDVWRPAHFQASQWTDSRGDGSRFVNVIGRLRGGVSARAAEQEIRKLGQTLQKEHPTTDGDWQFISKPLQQFLYGSMRPALLMLFAASGVLLLIACMNVANLLLSRATTRSREVALRCALGASQTRIFSQFLAESTVLGMLGGGIGLLAAFALISAFNMRLPGALGSVAVTIDWRVAAFAFSVALLTSLFFGMVPAFQSKRVAMNTELKQGCSGTGGSPHADTRSVLIGMQVGLSLVLLVGASLLGQSLWNLLKTPLGFKPDHVLTFEIKLPWDGDPKVNLHFFDQLRQGLEATPGVVAVGDISALPTVNWHLRNSFDVDWQPSTARNNAVNVETRLVGGRYLEAMQIPLLAGQPLLDRDLNIQPAKILINQQFALRYGTAQNLLGRHLANNLGRFEIAGIIGDVRGTAGSLAGPVGPEVYLLANGYTTGRTLVVRSAVPPEQLAATVQSQVHRLDPSQAVRNMKTLEHVLDESVSQPRFTMLLLCSFAALALVLACVGTYGVVAYAVTQKSVEIGIRMALGASRLQIAALFVRRALFSAAAGIIIGVFAATLLSKLLEGQLYGIQSNYAPNYLLAAAILLLPVFVASVWPTIQATRVNPVETLRNV